MPGLSDPGWLLAIPPLLLLCRWLHRRGEPTLHRWVASLRSYQGLRPPLAQRVARQPPDPAWRRRALLLALLAVALAGPEWRPPQAAREGSNNDQLTLEHLLLRRSLRDPERLLGRVIVSNRTAVAAAGRLRLFDAGEPVGDWPIMLPPGTERGYPLQLQSTPAAALQAELTTDYPATTRQHLTLDSGPLPPLLSVTTGPACDRWVRRAIEAMPGVRPVERAARLAILCSDTAAHNSAYLIRISGGTADHTVNGPLQWRQRTDRLRRLRLDSDLFSSVSALAGDQPLLSAGATPLIIERRSGGRRDLLLALAPQPRPGNDQRLPLLLQGLIDYLLGDPLSEPVEQRPVQTDRALPAPTSAPATDLSILLLALALLLLFDDIRRLPRRNANRTTT